MPLKNPVQISTLTATPSSEIRITVMRYRTIVVARGWTADGGTSKRGIDSTGGENAAAAHHRSLEPCRLRTKSDVQHGNHHRPTCPPPRRVLREYVELFGDTR